eukprot:966664_1
MGLCCSSSTKDADLELGESLVSLEEGNGTDEMVMPSNSSGWFSIRREHWFLTAVVVVILIFATVGIANSGSNNQFDRIVSDIDSSSTSDDTNDLNQRSNFIDITETGNAPDPDNQNHPMVSIIDSTPGGADGVRFRIERKDNTLHLSVDKLTLEQMNAAKFYVSADHTKFVELLRTHTRRLTLSRTQADHPTNGYMVLDKVDFPEMLARVDSPRPKGLWFGFSLLDDQIVEWKFVPDPLHAN